MYRNDKNETHDQQEIHVRSVEHGICPIAELRVHDWTVRIVTEYRPRYGNVWFWFFKMAAAAILDRWRPPPSWIFEISIF